MFEITFARPADRDDYETTKAYRLDVERDRYVLTDQDGGVLRTYPRHEWEIVEIEAA